MDQSPEPSKRQSSTRFVVFTFGLAVAGIVLGAILWLALDGSTPGIIAAILGVYLIVRAGNGSSK